MFIEIPLNKKSISARKGRNGLLVFGVGINDADYIVKPKIDGKFSLCPIYTKWQAMLSRCYSKDNQLTYKSCTVCDEWLTFSVFRKWLISQDYLGNELDKDLLVAGNKIYSPDTCLLVSKQVNNLLCTKKKKGNLPIGVLFDKRVSKFTAESDGKYLGSFKSLIDAKNSYKNAKRKAIFNIAKMQKDFRVVKALFVISNDYRVGAL